MKAILALTVVASALISTQALADAQAVRQCQAECVAAFDRPSAELKQCVASCTRLESQPARPQTPAQPVRK